MTVAQFWTITSSEIKITSGGGRDKDKTNKGRGSGGWTGRGRGGGWGKGGGAPAVIGESIYNTLGVTLNNGADNLALEEIELYDAEDNLIGYATPHTGTADASSVASYASVLRAFEMEGNTRPGKTSGWQTNGQSTGWIEWKDDTQISVVTVALFCADSSVMPKDFKIEWSDNGSSWTTVLTVTGASFFGGENKSWTWAYAGGHQWWRMIATANNGGANLGCQAIRFAMQDGTILGIRTNTVLVSAPNYFDILNMPYKLFSGSPLSPGLTSLWLSETGTTTGNIKISHILPVRIAKIKLYVPNQSGTYHNDRMPKDFTFKVQTAYGGTSYTLLTVTGETWDDDPKEYVLVYPGDYPS